MSGEKISKPCNEIIKRSLFMFGIVTAAWQGSKSCSDFRIHCSFVKVHFYI